MKKSLFAILTIAVLASAAFSAEIASLDWNESNLDALRASDKAAVAEFVSQVFGTRSTQDAATAKDVGEFMWADLEGNGRYELLVTLSTPGGYFDNLSIYWKDPSGIRYQWIRGANIRNLNGRVKNLSGNRKDELIVPVHLPSDTYRGGGAMAVWPAVYRLNGAKYVEASSEFRGFYEKEVLPRLEQEIAREREKIGEWIPAEYGLAIAIMARDKVLRVIGRDPAAGLQEARRWMSSKEAEMRENAAAVLGDIGSHDDDLRILAADKNPSVSLAARFAMEHGASDIRRFNSAVVAGSSR